MRSRLIVAALVAVVIGAIIGYTWGAPGSGVIWTIALSVMVAGAAALTAVLIRTVFGLRRARAPYKGGAADDGSM